MKVAIYTRVSKPSKNDSEQENRRKIQEAENQARVLRQYCEEKGYEYTEYTDEASAGGTVRRPGFEQLMEDVKKRKYKLVLFWALDRFSREGTFRTLELLQEINKYGTDWKSYSEQYLESLGVFRDAIIAILAALAKQERVRIGERSKLGQAKYREDFKKGKARSRTGKNLPIGNQRKVVDILRVYDMLDKNIPQGDIAKAFNCSWMTIHRIKLARKDILNA